MAVDVGVVSAVERGQLVQHEPGVLVPLRDLAGELLRCPIDGQDPRPGTGSVCAAHSSSIITLAPAGEDAVGHAGGY